MMPSAWRVRPHLFPCRRQRASGRRGFGQELARALFARWLVFIILVRLQGLVSVPLAILALFVILSGS